VLAISTIALGAAYGFGNRLGATAFDGVWHGATGCAHRLIRWWRSARSTPAK
jgi:hypothetical protein